MSLHISAPKLSAPRQALLNETWLESNYYSHFLAKNVENAVFEEFAPKIGIQAGEMVNYFF